MLFSWKIFALGAAFFAALTAIFGKIGVSEMNSNLATFIRTIVILLITALMVTIKNDWQRPDQISSKSLIFLILSGVATGLSWLCYYKALQLGPASKVAPVDKLSVVLVIIISIAFLGEPFSWKVFFGGVFITCGSLLLVI
jgi:transporter family protein